MIVYAVVMVGQQIDVFNPDQWGDSRGGNFIKHQYKTCLNDY